MRCSSEILVEDAGLRFLGRWRTEYFSWEDFDRIEAYKLDQLVHDTICLDFHAGERALTLSEESTQWTWLLQRMAIAFPDMQPDWLQQVAFPPFEECRTLIFQRVR